ncbi:bacterial membrane flanked domain superfamily [Bifidobacterium goeldii]|uniref:Bacterial membrane flanked domain superfamily n=1 Tax=Bifidobacterium goeldii TaxID=2306975 RepID=A0A430FKY2_9BIFI|nr:PH domain-containing protein [Bifidobacterium goeldii]RSX53554.1 bacterial membrane flanked domain superfamily [Bifidobacterium goeldii]
MTLATEDPENEHADSSFDNDFSNDNDSIVSSADIATTTWHRLHPTALIVRLTESIRSTVGIFLTLLVIMRQHLSAAIIAWIFVAAIVVSLAQPAVDWLTTHYCLGPHSLSFRSGLLFRKHRTISYGAIHAISSTSTFYLRPFNVIQLSISPVGTGADITMPAVPATLQTELEQLRARALACSTTGIAADTETLPAAPTTAASTSAVSTPANACQTPAKLVFRASVTDILLFAVTDIGFLAAAFVIYGFVQNLQDILPNSLVLAAEHSIGDTVMHSAAAGVMSVILLIAACVMILMIVSIGTSLLRFYGFEVWRRGDDLMVERGLFTRHTTIIPVSRIQTIVIRRSALRRPLHLCSVQLGLSASSRKNDVTFSANILPVLSTRRVTATLRAMLPEWDCRLETPVQPTGRGLTRYYVTVPAIATIAASAIVGVGVAVTRTWLWWLIAVPAMAGAWWISCRWMKSRAEGYAILPDSDDSSATADVMSHRIMTTGANGWGLFTMMTRRARVQSVTRSTMLWREQRGVESMQMSLFVMNGISELRFRFLRQADADVLADWARGR